MLLRNSALEPSRKAIESGLPREEIARILQQEFERPGRRFPAWVTDADATDWRCLGEEYLELCSNWCGNRPCFTDKTLTNWQMLGVIPRMLPGTRIVNCLRNPLETAWSCYKRNFGETQVFT